MQACKFKYASTVIYKNVICEKNPTIFQHLKCIAQIQHLSLLNASESKDVIIHLSKDLCIKINLFLTLYPAQKILTFTSYRNLCPESCIKTFQVHSASKSFTTISRSRYTIVECLVNRGQEIA